MLTSRRAASVYRPTAQSLSARVEAMSRNQALHRGLIYNLYSLALSSVPACTQR